MTAELKTVKTKVSPKRYLEKFPKEVQKDALVLVKIFEKITKKKGVMWGEIFGFGEYEYVRSTGDKFNWMATAFAIRKAGFVVYTIMGHDNYPEILKKLGKFKNAGKSCISFRKLEDIDLSVLEQLIKTGYENLKKKYKVN